MLHGVDVNRIVPSLEPHLTYTQRVVGDVLIRDENPHDIWYQHEDILKAASAGNGEAAEALVRAHLTR